jgi:O-acetyl-ADP-ribose deacetylase (regulator of RNase III)
MKERISVKLGDITEEAADAIVNAANSELILGGGVAGAIRRRGGPAIQSECDKIGPIKVGQAAVTCAGNLKAKYVIHAASMSLSGVATAETLKQSMRDSFAKAAENGVRSIAIPAVGAGIAGFPMRRCAEILMDEAKRALMGRGIEKVTFVLFDRPAYEAFVEAHGALGN